MFMSYVVLLSILLSSSVLISESRRILRQTEFCSKGNGICLELKTCVKLYNLTLPKDEEHTVRELLDELRCQAEDEIFRICCHKNISINSVTKLTKTASQNNITTRTEKEFQNISECGIPHKFSTNRIVGGSPADLGDWPWIVALGYPRRGTITPTFNTCAGTLITDKHVITAAHCLFMQPTVIRLGDLDLDDKIEDGANPITIPIAKIIKHPKFGTSPFENDIAIIKLQRSVSFTDQIRPLCLPFSPEIRNDSFKDRMPIIIGWGHTKYGGSPTTRLQVNGIPVVSNDKCKIRYTNVSNAIIDHKIICAGGTGNDTCQGDSGGPLILPIGGPKCYLIGIVSYGVRCATEQYPGIYTRVTAFKDWILDNLT